eukprot:SAG22_NODE_2026_length_3120_cov_2.341278_2_plen_461_part_00
MTGQFGTSTHAQHWMFTEGQVDELRKRANAECSQRGGPRGRAAPGGGGGNSLRVAARAAPGGMQMESPAVGSGNQMMLVSPFAPPSASAAQPGPDAMAGPPALPAAAAAASSLMMVSPMLGAGGQPAGGAAAAATDPSDERFLSVAEESELRLVFELRIKALCQRMKNKLRVKPEQIQATAISYFKRFFVRKTMMDYSPRSIMLAALYVATKIDEAWYENLLDELLGFASEDPLLAAAAGAGGAAAADKAAVVEHEMVLLSVLEFQMVVFHPYRPLRGFLSQAKEWAAQPARKGQLPAGPELDSLEKRAFGLIGSVFTTDIPLLYQPAQVALACLFKAVELERPSHGAELMRCWDQFAAGGSAGGGAAAASAGMSAALQDIQARLQAGAARSAPDAAQVQRLAAKLALFADGAAGGGAGGDGGGGGESSGRLGKDLVLRRPRDVEGTRDLERPSKSPRTL